ncbi:MAG: hypothetical protein ACKO9A_15195, partial [Alphaproteobacteria bacterium]
MTEQRLIDYSKMKDQGSLGIGSSGIMFQYNWVIAQRFDGSMSPDYRYWVAKEGRWLGSNLGSPISLSCKGAQDSHAPARSTHQSANNHIN